MDFGLSEEIRAIKELARRCAKEVLGPIAHEDYEKGITRREIVEEMGRLGLFGCLVPEEYGGTSAGYLAAVVIAEELAKISASYAGYLICQLAGPPVTILKYGTEEQKRRLIPDILSGKSIPLFAATESDAGSDVTAMRTVALDKGDHYLINGTKTWITNATIADCGLLWVYTNREKKHRGMSCLIVDMRNTTGITAKKIEKVGLKCLEAGELILEEVRAPKENRLGRTGEGYEILMFTLSNTRLLAAARALGVAEACIEASVEYAKGRVQFGKPIGDFQMIQNQLVDMYVEHEAARALVYQAAKNKDEGHSDVGELATAKYFACETGLKAALTAMRIYSSYGFSTEYPIHRYVRDALAFPITEGTSNIQKVIIAKTILKP